MENVLKHLPGSEEWLQERLLGIGGSDAPIVMGCSPWMTPYQLWELKLELRMPDAESPPMSYGKKMEPIARARYEDMTGTEMYPLAMVHASIPHMRGSFDGMTMNGKRAVEIKCPYPKKDGTLPELYLMAMKGDIPEYYQVQMQHLMEVGALPLMDYCCYAEGQETVIIELQRDQEKIDKIIEVEAAFWDCVESKRPPALTDRDHAIMNSPRWISTSDSWKKVTEQIKILKKEEEDLRQALIEEAQDRSASGNGLKLTRYVRQGNIDYSSIPQLKDIDVNQYRKKDSVSYRITEI